MAERDNTDTKAPLPGGPDNPGEPHPRGTDIPGELLSAAHAAYLRWFGKDYDLGALDCVLSAAAAERLGGDPAWILIVGGSGAAKTETVMPLTGAGAIAVSTINGEAALLSGTPEKERAKDATGGLLRMIGSNGVLVIKDVTSILSMNRDTRALVLAALREIYDGRWGRYVGSEGGRTLTWEGRIVVIGAVTTAWDSAYSVISTMGDRFVLVRLNSGNHRKAAGRQAMLNVSSEVAMRAELSDAVKALLGGVDPDAEITLGEDEVSNLLDLADLVTRARTAVERDGKGNPAFAHALEMPTRFAKQLVQIARGGIALGMPRDMAMTGAIRCARDSIPPLRLRVLLDVAATPHGHVSVIAKRLQLPRGSVDRCLQELHLLECLVIDEERYGSGNRVIYSIHPDLSREALTKFTSFVTTPHGARSQSSPALSLPLGESA